MSKKSKKSESSEPPLIYSAPHEEQVDLLAQALLREYMHRKKLTGTLATFDEECPRHEKTVSSRAVMGDLMHLNQERISQMKELELTTFMEMVCQDRVSKQGDESRIRELIETLQEPLPEHPEIPKIDDVVIPEPEPRLAGSGGQEEKKPKKAKKEKKIKQDAVDGDDGAEWAAKKKAKKEKKEKKAKKGGGGGPTMDDLFDSETPAAVVKHDDFASKPSHSIRKASGGVSDGSGSADAAASGASLRRKSNDSRDSEGNDDSSPSESDDEEEDESEKTRQNNNSSSPPTKKPVGGKQGWGGGFEDVQDGSPGQKVSSMDLAAREEAEKKKLEKAAATPHLSGPTVPVRNWKETPMPDGALGIDMARKLRSNFVGNDRRFPDSFIRQGFYLSKKIEYGLVQNEGGPCGVLAVLQGRLLAELRRRFFIITPETFPVMLAQVLAQTLQLSSAGRSVSLVVPTVESGVEIDAENSKSVAFQVQVIARCIVKEFSTAKGTQELEDFLVTLLQRGENDTAAASAPTGSWALSHGIGMTCFMLSQVLTRDLQTAMSDMDVESTLIVEHGYCSQELTNLSLCGRAVSNVHNGSIKQGDFEMKGFPQGSMDIGFLSALEVQQLLTVGTYGKKPTNPVWVIYNESHFTVLFSKETNATTTKTLLDSCLDEGGSTVVTEFDLFYYDQQGQDEEIKLSVRLDSMPIPASRRGMLIPYLNTIIRTMPYWKYAKVDWNGSDPLL